MKQTGEDKPWKQGNHWSNHESKPELCPGGGHLHGPERVLSLLSVKGSVDVVESKRHKHTAPKNDMVDHSLWVRDRERGVKWVE